MLCADLSLKYYLLRYCFVSSQVGLRLAELAGDSDSGQTHDFVVTGASVCRLAVLLRSCAVVLFRL